MSDAARLEKLRWMLAERERTPGFKENCKAIRAEIARLEETNDG